MSRVSDYVPDFKPEELQHLPRAKFGREFDQVRIEYETDHWDGPMSGMCSYHAKRFYFHCVEVGDSEDRKPRKFVLLALTEQQLRDEEYWHQQFIKHVKERPQDSVLIHRQNFYNPYAVYPFVPCTKDQAVAIAELI